jgi:hypothetical protein
VGLILIIVLIAVPQLSRNARNHDRKAIVGLTMAELTTYVQTSTNNYPATPDEYCDFIDNSGMRKIIPGLGSCTATLDVASTCVLVTGSRYSICYHAKGSPHTYVGPYDQINIQQGHYCGDDPADTNQYPISDKYHPHDSYVFHIVVWTPLETGAVGCASNNS